MKVKKHYVSGLAALGALSILLITAPAFAETNSNAGQNWRRGPGGGPGGEGGMMRPGVFGSVTAVNGSTLTVTDARNNTVYTVDASSATVMKDGSNSSLSSISVGDKVAVQGTVTGTSVKATNIRDGAGMMGRGGRGPEDRVPGVFGKVTAISGSTLTVTSQRGRGNDDSNSANPVSYTVNAASATVTKNGSASSLSGIAVEDMVMVEGSVSGTTVNATAIRDGLPQNDKNRGGEINPIIQGNGQPVIAGNVVTISGNTLTITNKSNVTYTVDATNAKIQKGNAISSVSNIATGDSVMVQGTVNGNSVTASSVIDQGQAPSANAQTTGNNGSDNAAKPHPGFFGGIGQFFAHLFGF